MSNLKTENLVILFTDIAGFTEATSLQSREQNQRLLERHNAILMPIVRRFRGRHIKSIGDAFLLAFTSPTDAMRCAMAMQDAMHGYNIRASEGEEIHLRVAASLGEVRVTRNDIFGEPVNVTSRIEGITPADEIYFSEAVYLAMNKAEVPAVEIGLKELKGISKPVRIFAIPRFAQPRLVADSPQSEPSDPRLSFPFGGMHLSAGPVVGQGWMERVSQGSRILIPGRAVMGPIGGAIVATAILFLWSGTNAGSLVPSIVPTPLGKAESTPAREMSVTPGVTAVPVATVTAASFTVAPMHTVHTTPTSVQSAQVTPTTAAQLKAAVAKVAPKPPVTKPKPQLPSTIIQAKLAYKAGRITKVQYRDIVNRIEEEFDERVRQAKLDYKAGKLSKDQYRTRIAALKLRYIGKN